MIILMQKANDIWDSWVERADGQRPSMYERTFYFASNAGIHSFSRPVNFTNS